MNKPILCDLHIHSIASGHAFNTIDEITAFAVQKNYQIIGISDHGSDMERAPHIGYFEMLYRLPHQREGMRILYGCEANILDTNGTLDIPDSVLTSLDYVIAGLHKRTSYTGIDKAAHTKAITAVIRSQRADIIAHPISLNFLADPVEIANTAAENEVILECNLSVLREAVKHNRTDVILLYTELMRLSLERNIPLLLGSDAHHISEMDLTVKTAAMMEQVFHVKISDFLNNNCDKIITLLQRKRRFKRRRYS